MFYSNTLFNTGHVYGKDRKTTRLKVTPPEVSRDLCRG
jgi:hypothetical protein